MIQLEDGRLAIEYEMERDGLVFCDTIVGQPADMNQLTVAEIEAIKAERFENWYATVTAKD